MLEKSLKMLEFSLNFKELEKVIETSLKCKLRSLKIALANNSSSLQAFDVYR